MSTINLEQPITGGGVEWINFFNGRLLSGEDLTHEQKTTVLRDQRLGQAVGPGVVYGLQLALHRVGGAVLFAATVYFSRTRRRHGFAQSCCLFLLWSS